MYKDVMGLPTIGVGHLLSRSELFSGKLYIAGEPVRWSEGLTTEQIDALLAQDIKPVEDIVSTATGELLGCQFDALVSFTFNVGANAFLNSTLLKLIRSQDLIAIPAQLRRWTRAGGKVVQGLVNRREVEIKMWRGVYELSAT